MSITRLTAAVAVLALGALTNQLPGQHENHDHSGHEDHGGHEVADTGDAHDEHSGEIVLDSRDAAAFGIETAVAGPGHIVESLRIPGEIHMNQNTVAHVGPRFPSIAMGVHKRLGEEVGEGDILAEMESNDTLRPFQLVAPISGTIVDFHLTVGESVDPGEYAYIIADTSTVWADLRVYQRDLNSVRPGQPVTITTGIHQAPVSGVISYIGPVVDERTRTGLARAVIENPEGQLRPGMFIVGTVELREMDAPVVIPESALHHLDDGTVVYVESHDEGVFEQRKVVTGRRDSKHVEIRSGLLPGEHYAVKGGFFLKAESQKEHFGDGHAH